MNYRLFATDIDGTLRNSAHQITPETRNAVLALQEQGIPVAIVSGRPLHGMQETARELRLADFGGYLLAFNGGLIAESGTNRPLREVLLPKGAASRLFEFGRSQRLDMLTYLGNSVLTNNPENEYLHFEATLNGMPMIPTADFTEYNGHRFPKCLFGGDPATCAAAEELGKKLFPEFEFYRSEPFFLEGMPKGVDKGTGLKALCGILGLNRSAIVACGDGYNDVAMLAYAGMGVAMANGQDAAKKTAKYVTGSNDDEGLAQAIRLFFGSSLVDGGWAHVSQS